MSSGFNNPHECVLKIVQMHFDISVLFGKDDKLIMVIQM